MPFNQEHAEAIHHLETVHNNTSNLHPDDTPQLVLIKNTSSYLRDLLDRMRTLDQPEDVFLEGMSALQELDQRRFIVQNLLESVKNGGSLSQSLIRYNKIGLTNFSEADIQGLPTDEQQSPPSEDTKPGRFLQRILDSLKKAAGVVIRIICNAMKVIAGFSDVEPVVGFVGAFPNISFQLKTKSQDVSEILTKLIDGLWPTRPRPT
jgi:hypothetical protein